MCCVVSIYSVMYCKDYSVLYCKDNRVLYCKDYIQCDM